MNKHVLFILVFLILVPFHLIFAEKGIISLKCDPEENFEVYVDSIRVGWTLYSEEYPVGVYTLTIEKEGWLTLFDTVVLQAGETFSKTYEMQETYGTLLILAESCDVKINDRFIDKFYNQKELKLKPGQYIIKAERDKHYPEADTVTVIKGEETVVFLNPKPILSEVFITSYNKHDKSEVSGMLIYENERNTEVRTPGKLELLQGEHRLSLEMAGYPNYSKEIEITGKEKVEIDFGVESNSWYAKQQEKWKTHFLSGMGSSVLLTGAGLFCNIEAENSYEDYHSAESVEKALSYRDKVKNYQGYRDLCYISVSGAAFYMIYSWFKMHYYGKKSQDGRRL